jgi:hypothetical protein
MRHSVILLEDVKNYTVSVVDETLEYSPFGLNFYIIHHPFKQEPIRLLSHY